MPGLPQWEPSESHLEPVGISVVLRRVVRQMLSSEQLQVLAMIAERSLTVEEVGYSLAEPDIGWARRQIGKLYLTGFITGHTANNETRYRMRPLPEIVGTQLKEGWLEDLDDHDSELLREYYIRNYVMRTASRIEQEILDHSSEVIPVQRALPAQRQVLGLEMRMQVLSKAKTIALTDCSCRMIFNRCEAPVNTCILLDEAAVYYLSRGRAEPISVENALEVMNEGNREGLVTMTLLTAHQRAHAICSCCSCCCHEFQALLRFHKKGCIKPSGFVASVNIDMCRSCGVCIDGCPFGAMIFKNGTAHVSANLCHGCGLCVTSCKSEAIQMIRRSSKESVSSGMSCA